MFRDRKEDAYKIAAACAQVADDKKATDIVTLQVSGLTTVADYFVICSAKSQPQMNALSKFMTETIHNDVGLKPLAVDGTAASSWILIDFGPVMIHIMTPETRDLYDLETLWGDAPKINTLEN